MGSIMCLGVSVSNSVMLVTFMDEHWKGGSNAKEAAISGAGDRLRGGVGIAADDFQRQPGGF